MSDPLKKEFVELVETLYKTYGLSYRDIAKKIGISTDKLHNARRGSATISVIHLSKVKLVLKEIKGETPPAAPPELASQDDLQELRNELTALQEEVAELRKEVIAAVQDIEKRSIVTPQQKGKNQTLVNEDCGNGD